MSEASVSNKGTTLFRECLGLFGAFAWFFCSMYSYEDILFESYFYIPAFLLALFLSMLGFSLYCKRDTRKLSKIAAVLAPCGIICTAVMYLLPLSGYIALYIASGIFMGPLLVRCIYGAAEAGGEKRRFRCYFQAIALTVIFHSVWAILPVSHALKFPMLAFLVGVSWFVTRRTLPEPVYIEQPRLARKVMLKQTTLVILATLLILILDDLYSAIHTHFVDVGYENDLFLWFGGTILPAIAFFLFAYFFDKQRERGAFLFGMGFALLGLILTLIPKDSFLITPLLITDGLGGTFTEFIVVASSVYLYRGRRRPFFVASAGLMLMILVCASNWMGGISAFILPPDAMTTDPAMILLHIGPAAVITLLFIALGLYLMDRQQEKNIVYAILGRLRTEALEIGEKVEATAAVIGIPDAVGLLPEERQVAVLLMEGLTSGEIARKLRIPSADVGEHMRAIRSKVAHDDTGERLERIAVEYKLTGRETQILRGICEGKSNPIIAGEHYISEATVKFHASNLMKKLPVQNRAELREWVQSGAGQE